MYSIWIYVTYQHGMVHSCEVVTFEKCYIHATFVGFYVKGKKYGVINVGVSGKIFLKPIEVFCNLK